MIAAYGLFLVVLQRGGSVTSDARYLVAACRIAARDSDDPRTQNGAVLRAKSGYVVAAANTVPAGSLRPDRLSPPLKYSFMEHAERNVIYTAARQGVATHQATLYCPWFACCDCARAIIQAGVTRVVGHTTPRLLTPERWQETIALADDMLRDAGVELAFIDDVLGVQYRFNDSVLEL